MKGKTNRTKGKLQLSKYFQKFKDGDFVAITIERSKNFNFPERYQGRTGVIEGSRGKTYWVRINDQTKEKTLLVEPIHLKKIKKIEKK